VSANVSIDQEKDKNLNGTTDKVEIIYTGQNSKAEMPGVYDKDKLFDYIRNYAQNCQGSIDKYIVFPYANLPDYTNNVE